MWYDASLRWKKSSVAAADPGKDMIGELKREFPSVHSTLAVSALSSATYMLRKVISEFEELNDGKNSTSDLVWSISSTRNSAEALTTSA